MVDGFVGELVYSDLEIVHDGPGPALTIIRCSLSDIRFENVVVRWSHPDGSGVLFAYTNVRPAGEGLSFDWVRGLTCIGPDGVSR